MHVSVRINYIFLSQQLPIEYALVIWKGDVFAEPCNGQLKGDVFAEHALVSGKGDGNASIWHSNLHALAIWIGDVLHAYLTLPYKYIKYIFFQSPLQTQNISLSLR